MQTLFGILTLGLTIGLAIALESSRWRRCPICKLFWRVGERGLWEELPDDSDGVVQSELCRHCQSRAGEKESK